MDILGKVAPVTLDVVEVARGRVASDERQESVLRTQGGDCRMRGNARWVGYESPSVRVGLRVSGVCAPPSREQ